MAPGSSASESTNDKLIRLIGEEYQREQFAKWNKYGGLRALCEASWNLPVFPKLSKKGEKKLNAWKKEVIDGLTKKKSPGALKLKELKQNIRAKSSAGEQQRKSITAVELVSHVPELVSILNIYLRTFMDKNPHLISTCIRIFVLFVIHLIAGPITVPLHALAVQLF